MSQDPKMTAADYESLYKMYKKKGTAARKRGESLIKSADLYDKYAMEAKEKMKQFNQSK